MNAVDQLPHADAGVDLLALLRADLVVAMNARHSETVALLRTVIAAIDNAQSVEMPTTPTVPGGAHIAGAQPGVGSTEAARRVLSDADVRALLQAQIDERKSDAERYEAYGKPDTAAWLHREADALRAYIATWDERQLAQR